MSGLIIAEYQFRERTKCGLMPKNPAMVKTIVTTNMADPLAADYNVNLIEVLTGSSSSVSRSSSSSRIIHTIS